MRTALIQLVTAGNMSADITSRAQQLNQAFGYSVQANFTTNGTLGGTLKLQLSLDHIEEPLGNVLVAGNWVDVTSSSHAIAAAGTFAWNQPDVMYPWVRLVYTHAGSDSGVLNVYLFERAF